MKQLFLPLIAAVAMVGCASTPYTSDNPFTNSLGMKFVPVAGTEVSFCIWETRVKDYAAYAMANVGVDESWKEPPYFKAKGFRQADTHPVVMVSWKDVVAFCEWLTKKELAAGKIKVGQRYRLPTDAEWSVAVGLGGETGNSPEAKHEGVKDVYPWGNQWPPPKGAGNYDGSLNVDSYEYTSPVGSFAANKFGLHDMGGNVWEWCEDWYDPATKEYRVFRGTSWLHVDSHSLLSSRRGSNSPDDRTPIFGFRCVLAGE
jgi:formylglycine-generating enzyme required for sulfatase activity